MREGTLLAATVLRLIRQYNLLLPNETVVIAVSGGTDSLALLHLLMSLQTELDIALHAATLDHGLRQDAAAEVEFVRNLAYSWHIPFTSRLVDVPRIAADQSIGIELAARRARYSFLAEVAHEVGAQRIVTAHHANDQVETVLMHILRGTGAQGLQGMALISPLPGASDLLLVRPLLRTSRALLDAYCREHELHPREDLTNLDTDFLRNHIRWQILPLLRQVNPRIDDALLRLADIAGVEQNYLDAEYERFAIQHIHRAANRVQIDLNAFRRLHTALQRRCVYREARHILPGCDLRYAQILQAVDVASTGEVSRVTQLGGGVRLRVDYDMLYIERTDEALAYPEQCLLLFPGVEIPVAVPGETRVPGADWTLRTVVGATRLSAAQASLVFPQDSGVLLRTRRPGDRIALLGMKGHTQKIKDWMINRKVAYALRDRIPLLVVGGEIAAICMGDQWTIADPFAMRKEDSGHVDFFVNYS